jgi:hypothetical protein
VKARFGILLSLMILPLTGYDAQPATGWIFSLEKSMSIKVMSIDEQESISAPVILPSASRRRPDGQTAITPETVRDFQPTAETVAEAKQAFAAAAFDVGPTVATSLSIAVPAGTFMRFFRTPLGRTARSGFQFIPEDGSASEELPLKSLPESLTRHVVAVTFTPPPDFGPTSFCREVFLAEGCLHEPLLATTARLQMLGGYWCGVSHRLS